MTGKPSSEELKNETLIALSKNSRSRKQRFDHHTCMQRHGFIYRTRATITRILRKKPLDKPFLDFKKRVKSIQTVGYNGAHTVNGFGIQKGGKKYTNRRL